MYEAGDTKQFTLVTSVAPDSSPRLAIFGPNTFSTLVSSVTSTASDTTAFYAMVTMPSSGDGVYMAEWFAQKTVLGTPYPFYKRVTFVVARTQVA